MKKILKEGIIIPLVLGCSYYAWTSYKDLVIEGTSYLQKTVVATDEVMLDYLNYWKFRILVYVSIALIPNCLGLFDFFSGIFRFSLARQVSKLLYISFLIYEPVMRYVYLN
jgi:hypothetical protein